MENNEDNRQMTPIQEAIYNIDTQISVLQEALKLKYGTFFENIPYKIRCEIRDLENIKGMLESLLPKEREFANKMFQAGINNVIPHSHTWDDENYQYEYCTIEEKEFEQVFKETYTQDYKTK